MTKHTTSAGGVVINTDNMVLVVNQNGNSWSLPKGHIDIGEDEVTAAKREIYEESGISELTYIKKLGTYARHRIGIQGGEDTSEIKTIHMHLFTTNQKELSPQDTENPEARWVKKEEVANLLTHPKDKEFYLSIMSDL
ncbi:MAG: NUDIX domain-containing protein [bacterium]|nr:NUDIX domain-containing protein [bacterium]